jgi:hypothetical protein
MQQARPPGIREQKHIGAFTPTLPDTFPVFLVGVQSVAAVFFPSLFGAVEFGSIRQAAIAAGIKDGGFYSISSSFVSGYSAKHIL